MYCCCEQAVLDRLEQEDAEHEQPGEACTNMVGRAYYAWQAQTIALTASLVWQPHLVLVECRVLGAGTLVMQHG